MFRAPRAEYGFEEPPADAAAEGGGGGSDIGGWTIEGGGKVEMPLRLVAGWIVGGVCSFPDFGGGTSDGRADGGASIDAGDGDFELLAADSTGGG